jgi:hypothetical protein
MRRVQSVAGAQRPLNESGERALRVFITLITRHSGVGETSTIVKLDGLGADTPLTIGANRPRRPT